MKFILNGRTFDTATSSAVAIDRGEYTPYLESDPAIGAQSVRYEKVLYRTAKGALFVHEHETRKYPRGKPVVLDVAREMASQDAIGWIESNQAVILDSTGLSLPDEA